MGVRGVVVVVVGVVIGGRGGLIVVVMPDSKTYWTLKPERETLPSVWNVRLAPDGRVRSGGPRVPQYLQNVQGC